MVNSLPDADPSKPREEFVASTIRFIGQQDGPPERELKSHLASLLADECSVQRAYLARLQYDNASGVLLRTRKQDTDPCVGNQRWEPCCEGQSRAPGLSE